MITVFRDAAGALPLLLHLLEKFDVIIHDTRPLFMTGFWARYGSSIVGSRCSLVIW